MMPDVPDEFIPDGRAYLGVTCHGCGEAVPAPENSEGLIVYPETEGGELMADVLDIAAEVWHLRCAFDASPIVETAPPRTCPNCGSETPYRTVGAPEDYRVCAECPTSLGESGAEVHR